MKDTGNRAEYYVKSSQTEDYCAVLPEKRYIWK